jgi:hypothetical protein
MSAELDLKSIGYSEAKDMGRMGARDNKVLADNPFHPSEPQHHAWSDGWWDVESESNAVDVSFLD